MYRYVLFDLDGTLTDPMLGITNSVMYALEQFGIHEEDRTKLFKFIGPPLRDSFEEFYGFTPEQSEQAVKYYRERYGVTGLYENEVYDGIEDLVKQLQADGCHLIVATSKPEAFAIKIMEHFHLAPYFDFIAGASMDESRNKKSEVIEYALAECGIEDRSQVVMVGDREHDIYGAKSTGLSSIGVLFGYGTRQELELAGADNIAATPGEVYRTIMDQKLVFNPYLPLHECIPDGEPHVFGDRVYLYGSHDKEGGETFCMLDYVVYSAPVTDLTAWKREGVIYRAKQDPDYQNRPYMYAPDVVRGNDGRYYLYYSMSGDFGQGGYHGPISVAVCDTPAGEYEYLGYVRNPDGSPMLTYVCFDPAVINDDGVIRIYYGTRYSFEEDDHFQLSEEHLHAEMEMFHKSAEEILGTPESVMGPSMVTVGDDMMTITSKPCHVIPYAVKGTGFEEHPFFEGSSIRKIGEMYYFIYSSLKNHELCYATSRYPDRDYVYGGTIVSNGDVGMYGRRDEDRLNMTGTTHGSMEKIGEDYYIFYHRLTHKSDYSRQACAQKIKILPDGSIPQVEITSCGFDQSYLPAKGEYPAVIACNITNGHMPHGSNRIFEDHFPNVTNCGEERYIGEIADGTLLGYKYFTYPEQELTFKLRYRSSGVGTMYISTARIPNDILSHSDMCNYVETHANGSIQIKASDQADEEQIPSGGTDSIGEHLLWETVTCRLTALPEDGPLYLVYRGEGEVAIMLFTFES